MWLKSILSWLFSAPPVNPPPKILLVDDEEDLLSELEAFLEEEGYQVFTAKDGETALQIIEESKPDLVLLDLNIPKLSGFQILEKIKPKETGLKVLIFSGVATAEDQNRALALGATDCLTKPIAINYLLKEIETHIGKP